MVDLILHKDFKSALEVLTRIKSDCNNPNPKFKAFVQLFF